MSVHGPFPHPFELWRQCEENCVRSIVEWQSVANQTCMKRKLYKRMRCTFPCRKNNMSSSLSVFRSYQQKTLKSPSYDASLPLNVISSKDSLLALSSFTKTADLSHDSTVQREESKLVLSDMLKGEILSDRFIESSSGDASLAAGTKVDMLCFQVVEQYKAVLVSFGSSHLILYKLELNPKSGKHKKLRVWRLDGQYCVSMAACPFDASSHIVALGFSNGHIRLLDLKTGKIFKHFTSGHTGRIDFLKFASKDILWSCAFDGLRQWNVHSAQCTDFLLRSTVSDIRSIDEDRFVVTCANRTLTIHSLSKPAKPLHTIPLFDTVTQLLVLPQHSFTSPQITASLPTSQKTHNLIVTFSEEGYIRLYDPDASTADALFTAPLDPLHPSFVSVHYCPHQNTILAATDNADILFYSPATLEREKQFVGFNEAVMDVTSNLHNGHNELIVASNSDRILLLDRTTQNTEFLTGHSDAVTSVATASCGKTPVLVSSSRDRTVRVWDLNERKAIGLCDTHTDAVTAVAVDPKQHQFFASVGEDTIMKVYPMKQVKKHIKKWKGKPLSEEDLLLLSNESRKVHEKDVNDIDISVNGKFIATASFDKKVKIWNSADLSLEDTFVHKKGVWTVRFSPTEKVIATGSADHMIRIWSLSTHTCLKVFEGHAHHVMRVAYLNRGTQLLSGASSGMTKLWNIKTAECLATYDTHSDRVWGIEVLEDGKEIITGAEDRKLIQWTENTRQVNIQKKKNQDELILQDQTLRNMIKRKDYEEAIVLALSMDQPRKVYGLFEDLLSFEESKVQNIIKKLDHTKITRLLEYAIDWNTNSRFCHVAHHILHSMFRLLDPKFVSWSYEKSVDSLIAYSQKHYKRLENLIESSYLLDYTIHQMKILLPEEEVKALEEEHEPIVIQEKIEVIDPEDMLAQASKEDQKHSSSRTGRRKKKSQKKKSTKKLVSKQDQQLEVIEMEDEAAELNSKKRKRKSKKDSKKKKRRQT